LFRICKVNNAREVIPAALGKRHWASGIGQAALGKRHWASGIGQAALGKRHWASGIGQAALGRSLKTNVYFLTVVCLTQVNAVLIFLAVLILDTFKNVYSSLNAAISVNII
jgi:hypothetical protein